MRRTVFAVPSGPAQPLSDDPDVHELGVAPRWRTLSVAGREAAPPGAVRVRLPRRLSGTRQEASGWLHVLDASNVLRWLRGELPFAWVGVRSAGAARAWEAVFPRRGLGRPKPLPQRQPRPCPRCAEMDGWGCEDHQRPPLTLRTLLQASYELEARGPVTRNPDGTVNVGLRRFWRDQDPQPRHGHVDHSATDTRRGQHRRLCARGVARACAIKLSTSDVGPRLAPPNWIR